MTDELLPCPFCGCKAIYVTHSHYYDDEDTVCVFCNGCKSLVILEQNEAEGINDKTKAEAIAAWNTRAERTCHAELNELRNAVICSECGSSELLRGWEEIKNWEGSVCLGTFTTHNYCPNCGARVIA